jgi:hypothetical protein
MARWTGDDRAGERGPEWERVWTSLRDGEFLGPEDGVRKRGLVSINRGWLARGGLLRLYADRIEFEPNPLERLMLARGWSLRLGEIVRLERRPERPDQVSPVGQTPRMRLHTSAGAQIDVIPAGDTLDDWLGAMHHVWAWHARSAQEQPE